MTPLRASKVHRSRKYTRAPSPLLVLSQQKHGHGNKESGASPNQLVERVTSRVYLHRSYGCPHPLSIHTRFSPHYRYHISPTNERLSETNTQSAYTCILSYVARGTCQGRSSRWCTSHERLIKSSCYTY